MNELLLNTSFITCCILSFHTHADEIRVQTTINVPQLMERLSLDDILTILSAGKLKALIAQPEIAEKLQILEQNMDAAFRNVMMELSSNRTLSEEQILTIELAFKQKIVLAIYAALYKKAQTLIAEQGSHEQHIILANQLTPEKLSEFFA